MNSGVGIWSARALILFSPLMCINMNSYMRDILASLSKLLNRDISSETVTVCACCCGTEDTLSGIDAAC